MNNRILFVDDDENILASYKRNLRAKFSVTTNLNAVEALELLKNSETFSVIVSDYKMPVMDGITFLSKAKEISPDSVRMILTGYADINNAIKAVNEGNVFRFLTKPISHDGILSALNAGIEQYKLITSEKELLNKTLKGSIKVLIDILSAVNPTAFSLASSVSRLSRKLAERLQCESVWEVELAGLLSQIGCVTIPEELLEKKFAGKNLTEEEDALYNSHPQIGSNFLKNIPRLEDVSDAITFQMKRFDDVSKESSRSEKQKSVIRIAQIVKVATDFSTLTKSGRLEAAAIDMMIKDIGNYDPDVLAMLETEYSGIDKKFTLKNLNLIEISEGMIIAQNIYDANNLIFLRKGMEITSVLKVRLWNLSKVKRISEPIKMFVPI